MKDFQLPKFKIGDVVWLASSDWQSEPAECPDCLGEKAWEVVTPAGEIFSTHCRTCWHGYDGCSGTVSNYTYLPTVRRMTVGMVNTRQSDLKAEIQYMCEESGIGSGSLWDEEKLFPTETEARIYATTQAQLKRSTNEQCIDDDRRRQNKKDMLVVEDCPRKVQEDEVNRLKQEIRDLKQKYVKKRVKKTSTGLR